MFSTSIKLRKAIFGHLTSFKILLIRQLRAAKAFVIFERWIQIGGGLDYYGVCHLTNERGAVQIERKKIAGAEVERNKNIRIETKMEIRN